MNIWKLCGTNSVDKFQLPVYAEYFGALKVRHWVKSFETLLERLCSATRKCANYLNLRPKYCGRVIGLLGLDWFPSDAFGYSRGSHEVSGRPISRPVSGVMYAFPMNSRKGS